MTDEDLKIFADDILDFLNGHEASCVKLRVQIEKLFGAKKILTTSIFTNGTTVGRKKKEKKGAP